MPSLKLTASQAKSIYLYKNLKAKVQRCCSNIYFNRQCLKLGLIPKYAQIKIPYTSPDSIVTRKKTQTTRLKEKIKFLYKKKDKLIELLYRTHLQAAQEWGKMWDLIRDNIHTTLNLEAERIYKNLDDKISRLTNSQHERINEKFKFYPRMINQTHIFFTEEEQTLLNKGLKYNLSHKNKYLIRKLALEAENAITLLPIEEQDYMRYQVAKQIQRLQA